MRRAAQVVADLARPRLLSGEVGAGNRPGDRDHRHKPLRHRPSPCVYRTARAAIVAHYA